MLRLACFVYDVPAKLLRRLIRYPDFRQKSACIELGEHAGVDRIGLDLRVSDDAHLLWVSNHDLLDVRRDRRTLSGGGAGHPRGGAHGKDWRREDFSDTGG